MPPFPTGVARQQGNNPRTAALRSNGHQYIQHGGDLRVQVSKRSIELDFTLEITTFQLLWAALRSFWLLIWLGQKLGFLALIINLVSCQKELDLFCEALLGGRLQVRFYFIFSFGEALVWKYKLFNQLIKKSNSLFTLLDTIWQS